MQIPRIHARALPRSTQQLAVIAVSLVVLAALVVVMQTSAATNGAQVKAAKTSLGRVLVDGHGKTLYLFAIDKRGKSVCSGQCAVYWPPLLTQSKAVAGTGVKASLLGTAVRAGGKLQVTYNGHPLYFFKADTKAGQTKGQGVDGFGGLWWAVSPAGAAVKHSSATTSTPPPPTTTTDPGYGGYGP
jgi:predicted lipoprotein with Yx(FWY)xxD motif